MKLPGINYGGRAESLGRHDISLPAREAAAKSQVIGAVEGVAGQIYQDINEREMRRQQAEYNATMLGTEGDVNERINNGERVFGTQEMAYAGADMTQYGDQLEYRDYEAITPFYTSSMTQAHTSAMEKITSPRLRESIENDWKSHLVKGQMKAMSVQNSRHKEATLAQMNGELEIARAAGAVGSADAIIEEQLELNLISPEFARKEKRDTGIRVEGDQYFELLREDNIDGIRNAITRLEMEDKPYLATGGVLNDGDRAKWIDRLQDKLDETSKKKNKQHLDALNETIKERATGVGTTIPDSAADFIIDEYTRDKAKKSIRIANATGDISASIATKSPAQIIAEYQADVDAMRKQGDFNYDSAKVAGWDAAIQRKAQLLKADAPKYTLANSPALTALKEKADAATNQIEGRVTLRAYNQAQEAEQMRQGVARGDVSLLTQAQSTAISVGMQRTDVNGTPNFQARAIAIAGLQRMQGSDWPVVHRQLIKEGRITGNASIIAGLGVEHQDVATDLAAYSSVPPKDLKAQNKMMPGGSDVTDKQWENGVSEAVGEYVASMPITASVAISEMHGALETMARGYHASGKASSPDEAIERAKATLIDEHYSFSGRLRVPADQDIRSIESGLDRVMDAGLPAHINIGAVGTDEDSTQTEAKEYLRENGFWMTAGDGTRARLYWPDNSPVTDENGNVVEASWAHLHTISSVADPRRQGPSTGLLYDPGPEADTRLGVMPGYVPKEAPGFFEVFGGAFGNMPDWKGYRPD